MIGAAIVVVVWLLCVLCRLSNSNDKPARSRRLMRNLVWHVAPRCSGSHSGNQELDACCATSKDKSVDFFVGTYIGSYDLRALLTIASLVNLEV